MSQNDFQCCCVSGATLRGVEAIHVKVEVSIFSGLPSFSIVGMPDASIKESKDRIIAAIKSSGFKMPNSKIIVNLAPGSIQKNGSGFDLPIAVAILALSKQISYLGLKNYLMVGELSLNGLVRSIPGIVAYARCAKINKLDLLSAQSQEQAIFIAGLNQFTIHSLKDLSLQNFSKAKFVESNSKFQEIESCDFKDIMGHDIAKRALQISACGNHGVLMVGPPGSGKSMLAQRVPSILPRLTENEKIDVCVIHSIAGENISKIVKGIRPFRSPHHSATLPGLIGGGKPIKPGEVSLAHLGVLYLDELAEFKPHVLQGIRQPMESGNVTVTRADGVINFPAKFSLITSTNPCPCGYYGDSEHECSCSPSQIANYRNRIGGPVLDRIDIHIDVNRIKPKSVLKTGNGLSSKTLYDGVVRGINFRRWRISKENMNSSRNSNSNKYAKHNLIHKKGNMELLVESCKLSHNNQKFFEDLATQNNMSGRAIMRVLSVARTIADINEQEAVNYDCLCEALTFRLRDKLKLEA